MATHTRFAHVNLVSRDWRALSRFYSDVFDCVPVPPERDQAGPWLNAATGIPDLRIRGVHMRLPGHGPDGPTLEIYSYEPSAEAPAPVPNRPGFGHIAFAVDDVETACDAIRRAGGSQVGDIVTTSIPDAGIIQFAYMRDPEGNILEIQTWS
jgi:catechol 2,3-dioxygenase-like lactoylglutathione lyase family enzyme